jgi:hypothetical protein
VIREVLVMVLLGTTAAALSACESTADKSARIAREGRQAFTDNKTLRVDRSRELRVARTAVVRGDGGAIAAAVEIRNRSARAQRDVPVLIDVRGRGGTSLYKNDTVGLQPALQRLASVRAHGTAWWVNDQVTAATAPRRVVAEVGRAPAAAAVPALAIEDPHFDDDATGRYLTGTVTNPTNKLLRQVPVFAVALKGGRVVAAGRAFVAKLLPRGARKPAGFRIYFVGDARGARVALTVAPPAS